MVSSRSAPRISSQLAFPHKLQSSHSYISIRSGFMNDGHGMHLEGRREACVVHNTCDPRVAVEGSMLGFRCLQIMHNYCLHIYHYPKPIQRSREPYIYDILNKLSRVLRSRSSFLIRKCRISWWCGYVKVTPGGIGCYSIRCGRILVGYSLKSGDFSWYIA